MKIVILFRSVLSSVIDGNANRTSENGVQFSALQFFLSETSAFSGVSIVSRSAAVDNRSQQTDGLRESLSSLSNTGIVAAELTSRLVEPGFYSIERKRIKECNNKRNKEAKAKRTKNGVK